ncbi:MAG: bifunctional phosphopantothenoylcysteine decarboxylase/phosphopantothenate--cysteine ligase CoaBC [Gammaproteobacteria bacterium]|nr:MAG: bifunctional phosphopantothenoylcysteine decarboxylase/phosphopantothenate--cysteine ligase CoaBC [Gammaproteobacteria bacterium]
MGHLFNRNIVLGVSGGIAAYKSAELVRQLQQHGANVRVVMTRGAIEFITPLTLQALSGNPVHTELLDTEAERGMGHIELARWADLLVIAPTTADLLARLAQGAAGDLLTTLALATDAPILLAPAMNQQMWRSEATGANVNTLRDRGIAFVGPAEGEQACGDVGPGRMSEPAVITEAACALFDTQSLAGLSVMITAGPTREALDPVRYLSNHSSGKMGYALAQAAVDAGAKCSLISGPVHLDAPACVERVDVESAQDMLEACQARADACDIFIACAAVADYRPALVAAQKIKKHEDTLTLELLRNPDILASIASQPAPPFCVGFAAETDDVLNYAKRKLTNKKLKLIFANDVSDRRIGFNSDDNAVTALWQDGEQTFPATSKKQLARNMIDLIAQRWAADRNLRKKIDKTLSCNSTTGLPGL